MTPTCNLQHHTCSCTTSWQACQLRVKGNKNRVYFDSPCCASCCRILALLLTQHMSIRRCHSVLTQRALWSACRQNLDDCLDKLQEIIDKAVEAVTPKEVDPEVAARVKRK